MKYLILFMLISSAYSYSCNSGTYLDQGKCVNCHIGYMCKDDVKTICPIGRHGSNISSILSECKKCDSVSYTDVEGSGSCLYCPKGHACKDGKLTCLMGTYVQILRFSVNVNNVTAEVTQMWKEVVHV